MSLMQQWINLFPEGKPRSNPNKVAGSSEAFPNFTAILSAGRNSSDWAYDDWDEDHKYPDKGVDSELAWMGGQFNGAQEATYSGDITLRAPGGDANVEFGKSAIAMHSFQQDSAGPKTTKIESRTATAVTKQTALFRSLDATQITNGYAASIAGLQEYGDLAEDGTAGLGLTLAAFKVL